MNIVGIGALRGLIGKSGVMPARSRHCNGEQSRRYATGANALGRCERVMNRSQENCLSDNHRLTCEVWGGDYATSQDGFRPDSVTTPDEGVFLLLRSTNQTREEMA